MNNLIEEGKKLLKSHNIDPSKAEYLYNYLENKDDYKSSLNRLIEGIPIQYIIGNVNFYGNEIKVNNNVLIPRFETEELVEKTLKHIKEYFNKEKLNIIDLGTGSGCIAITLKKELPNSLVTAVDISDGAIEVAIKNAKLNNCEINFIKSDFFNNIDNTYDVIISNPPYLKEEDDIMDIVINNEPHLALFADNNGLACYEKIVKDSINHINDKTLFAFEIGFDQGEDIKNIILDTYPNAEVTIDKDLQGKNRFVFAKISRN